MTRPSRNQDKLLLETAKRLLPELGVERMSLKRIATTSGVNLGMIHYYFQTKSALISRVLESIHEELVEEFESKTFSGNTSLERLRSGLIAIARVVCVRRKLIISLLRDFLGKDKESTKFFFELVGKRMQLIIPLIVQCQKEGYIEKLPLYQVLGFCMASINMPILMSEGIGHIPIKKMKLPEFTITQLASEEAIVQRVDMALKAIASNKRKSL